MENRQKKENLIELINKYNIVCPDCGKLFLGAIYYAEWQIDHHYLDGGLRGYLSCGKCPKCAEKCYNEIRDNLNEYIKEKGKIPCYNGTIYDYFGEEHKNIEFSNEEIEEFMDQVLDIECQIYLDDDTFDKQFKYVYHGKTINSGTLIDLFEEIKKKLRYI